MSPRTPNRETSDRDQLLRRCWVTLVLVTAALFTGLGGGRAGALLPIPGAILVVLAWRRERTSGSTGRVVLGVLLLSLLTALAVLLPFDPSPAQRSRQETLEALRLESALTGLSTGLEGLLEDTASRLSNPAARSDPQPVLERVWVERGGDPDRPAHTLAFFREEGGAVHWVGSPFFVPDQPPGRTEAGTVVYGDSLTAVMVGSRSAPGGRLTAAVLLARPGGTDGPAPTLIPALEQRLPDRLVRRLLLRPTGTAGEVAVESGPLTPDTLHYPWRGPYQGLLLVLVLATVLGLLSLENDPVRSALAAPLLYAAAVPFVLGEVARPLSTALIAPSWDGHQLTNQAFLAVAAAALGLHLLLRERDHTTDPAAGRGPMGAGLMTVIPALLGTFLLWGVGLALIQDLYRFAPTWFWARVAFLPTGRDLVGWLIAVAMTMAVLAFTAYTLVRLERRLGLLGVALGAAAGVAGGTATALLGAWSGSLWVAVLVPAAAAGLAELVRRYPLGRSIPAFLTALALAGALIHLPLKWDLGRLLTRRTVATFAEGLSGSGVGLDTDQVGRIRDRLEAAAREPDPGAGPLSGPDRPAYLLWRGLGLAGSELASGIQMVDADGHLRSGFVTTSDLFAAPPAAELLATVTSGQGRIALTGGAPGFFGEETLFVSVPDRGAGGALLLAAQRRPLGFLASGEERLWSVSDRGGEVERAGRLSGGLFVRIYDEAYRLLAEPRTTRLAPEAVEVPSPVVSALVERRASGAWYRRGWWGVTGADEFYFWLEAPTDRPALPGGAVAITGRAERRLACLGLVRPGLWGRVVEGLNLGLLFVGTLLLLFGLPAAAFRTRRVPLRRRLKGISFRTRLLIPLLVVALVPMIALWLFTRTFILDREATTWEQDLDLSLRRVQEGLLAQSQTLAEGLAGRSGPRWPAVGADPVLPEGTEWARFDAGLARVDGNLSDDLADRIPAREALLGRGPRSFMLRADRLWSVALSPLGSTADGGAVLVALPLVPETLRQAAGSAPWEVDLFLDGCLVQTSDPAPYTAGLLPRHLEPEVDQEGRGGNELATYVWGEVRGLRHLSAYRPLTDYVGLAVGTIAQRRFGRWGLQDPDLDRLFSTVASIYLLLVGAVTLVAVLVARRISGPVDDLTRSARRVSGGDLEVDIAVTRGDELGGLQKAFRQMLIALRENRDRLAQAERERAWQQMARQVAHEIKNPLTPMRLSAQFLRRAYEEEADGLDQIVQECTDAITEQVEQLRRIANEFSAYARLPVVDRVPARLNDPVADALNLFLPALPDGIVLVRELDPEPPELPLDTEQVRRVVINLIRNALDAMGDTGTLSVRTGHDDEAVWLEVGDTGEGIAPEVQERLFEPYFSTKTDGTGLGLAITRAVVDAHGGSMQVTSQPENGTTMTVRFPR
jgi:signal transduction histidine kinase